MAIEFPFGHICQLGYFCATCRDTEGGRVFRQRLIERLKLESVPVDFQCVSPRKVIFERKQKEVKKATTRFEICKMCPDSREEGQKCVLWKGCCFGRKRTRADFRCPDKPPRW